MAGFLALLDLFIYGRLLGVFKGNLESKDTSNQARENKKLLKTQKHTQKATEKVSHKSHECDEC